MKQTFTSTLAALLLTILALLTTQQAQAQDEEEIIGWCNIHITVKAAPNGGGKVFPYWKSVPGLKAWRDEWDFQQPVPVGEFFDTPFTMIYLYAQPTETDGYIFAGWYADNGDGVFDAKTDRRMSEDAEYMLDAYLDEDAVVYATQTAANAGVFPEQSTDLIWAYFIKGARVSVSDRQDDLYTHLGNCGSVAIYKENDESGEDNEVGDVVTIEAYPNDGYHFEYWEDKGYLGNVVSRENPYTFTVKGGEHYYAYFVADDAPEYDLPEEGGFIVFSANKTWNLHDESVKAGARALYMEWEDLVNTDDGKTYLDMSKELAQGTYTLNDNMPTILYGKGKVKFAYTENLGWYGEQLLKWSGTKGATVRGNAIYVYIFVPELGAFLLHGTNDTYNTTYYSGTSVKVPAGVCYFSVSPYDSEGLSDDLGNIPTVIGLSVDTYDAGMAGGNAALQAFLDQVSAIADVHTDTRSLQGHRVYTLSGLQVKTTAERGIYIVNGRKVVMK